MATKRSREATEDEATADNWMKHDTALSMLKFRNYVPRDKNLRFFMLQRPKVDPNVDIEKLGEPLSEGNSLIDIAPKKANWDLKRDVARKVARLERRKQRAIVELIRERVEGQAVEGDNLNQAIENRQREVEIAESDED